MLIVIGIVVAFGLTLAYVRAAHWLKEARRTRYTFANRDTYLFLRLDGPLGAGEQALVTMRALREALLLKVAGMNGGGVLIHASGLRLANARAFWLLIGGLGPVLLSEKVDLAVVSGRGTRVARHFRESGILTCLPSLREGERFLKSGQPRPRMPLDEEYVSSLLTPGRRRAACASEADADDHPMTGRETVGHMRRLPRLEQPQAAGSADAPHDVLPRGEAGSIVCESPIRTMTPWGHWNILRTVHTRIEPSRSRGSAAALRVACAVGLVTLTAATIAFAARERVKGVTNFGRVSETVFRGGAVTPQGLENLHDLGVRTVIDLAGKSGERNACRRLGITYYAFPMDADERPDDAAVERILRILRDAEEPVYVHCSAGKHRAGTIAALYRIRVQGWSPGEAWEEQQSYGFGSAKDHRVLYEYVYGRGGPGARSRYRDSD